MSILPSSVALTEGPSSDNNIEELHSMIKKVTGVDLSSLPITNDEVREAILTLEIQLRQSMMHEAG